MPHLNVTVGVRCRGRRNFEPKRPGDVGYDLFVVIRREDQTFIDRLVSFFAGVPCIVIQPIVGVRTIRSDLHLVMPNEVWAEVRPRSSTSRRKLSVLGGTIDSGYRGEMFTVLHNLGFMPRVVVDGERYAQVVFHWAARPAIRYISEDALRAVVENDQQAGGRGADGFGSTGA